LGGPEPTAMVIRHAWAVCLLAAGADATASALKVAVVSAHEHHHHHHGHKHGHHHHNGDKDPPAPAPEPAATGPPSTTEAPCSTTESAAAATAALVVSDGQILAKMHHMESDLDKLEASHGGQRDGGGGGALSRGTLKVNGPLPVDFSDRFSESVSKATGCSGDEVALVGATRLAEEHGVIDQLMFDGPEHCVAAIKAQAADPSSQLATGALHQFLAARDDSGEDDEGKGADGADDGATAAGGDSAVPPADGGKPDIDLSMPYGGLEPFGREDTAKELTDASIGESNAMVDQLERAEIAEERRAVFRALTRLRGAAISSFDGIAHAHTGNVEEYGRKNQWRKVHPVRHLADEESDVGKWAFPEQGGQ